MSSEQELLARWHAERPAYEVWGDYVRAKVLELLELRLGREAGQLFLRLPASPRTKSDASLVQKALFRKRYQNPYDDVEDKVGIRFVVLTSDDIPTVAQSISEAGSEFWHVAKSRDFVAEREADPNHFGYQSDHFVLRSKVGLVGPSGTPILPDLPCEVQIRSLLQHAYSEVTHDTIYKPSVKTTPEMLRAAAKAMALIEATDDYLRALGNLVSSSVEDVRSMVRDLRIIYSQYVGAEPTETALDSQIIEALLPLIEGRSSADISAWLAEKPYLANRILSNRELSTLYGQGSILAVYYCVQHFPNAVPQQDVLAADELAPVYSDLGAMLPY